MKKPRGIVSEFATYLNPFKSVEDVRRLQQSERDRSRNVAKAAAARKKKGR